MKSQLASRPVPIIDEAQEMVPKVLAELRLLACARLDSHILLTVVLAGDGRLIERFRSDELLLLASRIRVRSVLERGSPDELQDCLRYALQQAMKVARAICQNGRSVEATAGAFVWTPARVLLSEHGGDCRRNGASRLA